MWKQVEQQSNKVQSVPVSTAENTHSYGPLALIMDSSWNSKDLSYQLTAQLAFCFGETGYDSALSEMLCYTPGSL